MTPLHKAVSAIAGNSPALVLSKDAFTGFLLNNFLKTLSATQNNSVPIDGFPAVEARFTGLDVNNNSFNVVLSEQGGIIFAKIDPDFTANFSLHVAGQPQLEFSTVTIEVRNFRVSMSVSAPQLVLGSPDYDSSGDFDPAATRQAALAASGISETDVSRIEGALAFLMPRRIVNSAISTLSSINLASHFTALELRGSWTISLLAEGIVIVPSGGISVKENTGCPTQDSVPNLGIGVGPQAGTGDNQYSWPMTPGGVPGPTIHRANDRLNGFASLYAPLPLWEARFSKTMPGIVYRESDNGFIGYDLTFTVGLEYVGLRIDPARYGIVVDLSMLANGFAFLTVDVPCVGRSDLGYARFTVARSDLSILISFVLSKEGKLLLQASIENLNIGHCEATVSLFSRWLALAGGKAAVEGFIIDYVLKRVIEHNVPIKIREAIKQEVNSKNFKLLDLEALTQYTRYRTFSEVTFSGDQDSVLVGLMSNG